MSQSPNPKQAMEMQGAEQVAREGANRAQQQAMQQDREVKSELMQLIREDEALHGLSDNSRTLLKNLLSKAFPLGNYTENEVHELKWRFWGVYEMFLALHPADDSAVQGATRAWVHDKADARLRPLKPQEELAVFQVFTKAWAKLTPGEDMKQQEIFATVRSESFVERGDVNNDSGGIIGRFRS